MSHLDQLIGGLARERGRLSAATTDHERSLRCAWIAQREREIADERRYLGLPTPLKHHLTTK